MSESASTLRIDDLRVSRGGHPVLHGISLEVPQGQVTTLLGPNGAGKSTMVLAVGGVLRPTAGEAAVNGTNLTRMRPEGIRQAGVAIVPEGRRLLPDLTVEENMRVATYALGREDARAGIGTLAGLLTEYGTIGPGAEMRSWTASLRRIRAVFGALMDKPALRLTVAEVQGIADRHPARHNASNAIRSLRPALRWGSRRGPTWKPTSGTAPPAAPG